MYHLSLPLLVVLGVLLLSFLAAYLLAPLGHWLGHPFNEAARKSHRRAKALNRLREAATGILAETFPNSAATVSWSDVEAAGAVRRLGTEAQVQRAAGDPDAFLRQATVQSQALLLRACTARAAMDPEAKVHQGHQVHAQVDLAALLTEDLVKQATDFASMLDHVLQRARADAHEQTTIASSSEQPEDGHAEQNLQIADVLRTVAHSQPAAVRPAPQTCCCICHETTAWTEA